MNRINYGEDSENEEEHNTLEVISEMSVEREEDNNESVSFGELNLKKQYRRAFIAAQNRQDWRILDEKNLPKGSERKNSIYFYLELHPGVFHLVSKEISKYLCKEYKIKHRSGKPDRYGSAKTKNICYYYFKVGGKDKTLQLQFYTTKSAIDVKMTGAPDEKAEKHIEFGLKNGAHYFVDDIMPKVMDYLQNKCDVDGSKVFWGRLAKEGYAQEIKKDVVKSKANPGKTNTKKTNVKDKCSDCQKVIGNKVAIQCDGCNNMNLVECLASISENRIKDFTMGKEKFS